MKRKVTKAEILGRTRTKAAKVSPDKGEPENVRVERRRDGGTAAEMELRGYRIIVGLRPDRGVDAVTVRALDDTQEVSPRDVRRLPIDACIRVARAAASVMDSHPEGRRPDRRKHLIASTELAAAASAIKAPRGRPKRGRSTGFYRELAEMYNALEAQGVAPVPEIARRKKVSPNTVHQWVHRARKDGFLEPSQRSGRRKR